MFLLSSIGIGCIFRWLPPPTSGVMLYRHAEDLLGHGIIRAIDYRWVSNDDIATAASLAAIAGEDQQFFNHQGFDMQSIRSSIMVYSHGGKLRGASTISQQVAKNLFLTPSKNFVRKGLEVWFTLVLELLWDKERILEVYLNIAEFGDHIFGIEAASQHYFGIPAKRLNRPQAALLAATLPNPIRFKANQPSAYLIKRQQWILRQMQNLGELPQD